MLAAKAEGMSFAGGRDGRDMEEEEAVAFMFAKRDSSSLAGKDVVGISKALYDRIPFEAIQGSDEHGRPLTQLAFAPSSCTTESG